MKIGDKVICIYEGSWSRSLSCKDSPAPEKDKIYTINWIDETHIGFEEMPQDVVYNKSCFRKIEPEIERKRLSNKVTQHLVREAEEMLKQTEVEHQKIWL